MRLLRRQRRLLFVLATMIVLFISGSPYYFTLFPVRVFTHVFFSAVLGGWLLTRLRSGHGLPRTPLDALIVILSLWWGVTTLLSLDPRISAETLWFSLCHLLVFYLMADLIQRGQTRLLLETQFLMAALVVILAGVQLASWLFGLGLVPGTSVGWLEVAAQVGLRMPALYLPLGVTTWLAGYTAPLALVSAGWAMTTPRRDYRVVLWLLAGALTLVLVLTNSRGGLLAFGVSIGVFVLLRFLGDWQRARRRLVLVVPIAVLLAAGLAFALITSLRGGVRDTQRLSLWNVAGEMVRQYPLAGVGPGEFGRGYRMLRPPGYYEDRLGTAHNFFLNTAAETGLFGVVLALGFAGVIAWQGWRHWRGADGARRLRLAAVLAALVGFGVQNMVDLFVSTPLVLLMLLLVAFVVIVPRVRRTEALPAASLGSRAMAVGALILLALYALAFLNWDRAQSAFNRSLNEGDKALEAIDQAIALDPALHLYPLQRAYLIGQRGDTPGDSASLSAATAAYEQGVQLEPTWDTGQLNLAQLYLEQGDSARALAALAIVRDLNYASPGALQSARVGETVGMPSAEVARNYDLALAGALPFSPFWWQTDIRRASAETVLAAQPVDNQYRVLIDIDAARAAALVPAAPVTAEAWWVVGEVAYRAGDLPRAVEAFTQVIVLRGTGDDYASRARAQAGLDPSLAAHDLQVAYFLGGVYENTTDIAARLEADPAMRVRLLEQTVGTRILSQNFEGVLFLGRAASFQPYWQMRFDNVNRTQLEPVFMLANLYAERGDSEQAGSLYRYILERLPDDAQAQAALAQLEAGQ